MDGKISLFSIKRPSEIVWGQFLRNMSPNLPSLGKSWSMTDSLWPLNSPGMYQNPNMETDTLTDMSAKDFGV